MNKPVPRRHLLPLLALLCACGDSGGDLPADLEISVTDIDFGAVPIETRASQTFTVSNGGGGVIDLLSIAIVEGEANIYGAQRIGPDALAAGESATVEVEFGPRKEKTYNGRVQVRTNAPGEEVLYVDLTGLGAPSDEDSDGDGYSPADGDCNEGQPASFPGNPEICDGIDNNCDGVVPAGEADADYDGYRQCQTATRAPDCDDGDPNVYPGAPELCDNKDSDCDGSQSDGQDSDGDGASLCSGDCDDNDDEQAPGLDERCDGKDNNCNGLIDDQDSDGDGYSLCHPAGDCDDDDPEAHPTVIDASSTSQSPDGSPADPWPSIEAALGDVNDACPTFFLMPGTYPTALTLRGGVLHLEGANAATTYIVPSEEGARPFDVVEGAHLRLSDVTVRDGDTSSDGGAIAVRSAELTLERVHFSGNRTTGDGGAIASTSGALNLQDCEFSLNTAGDDGGAVAITTGSLADSGSSYQGNSADQGGALYLQSTQAELDGLALIGNTAGASGGAIAVAASASFHLTRSTLWLNEAVEAGGGVTLLDVASGAVQGCLFQDNASGDRAAGMLLGGGDAQLTVANNTLVGGICPGEGGGILVEATSPAAAIVANIVGWSHSATGLHATLDGNAVSYNTVFYTTSGVNYGGSLTAIQEATTASPDDDGNDQVNPRFVLLSDNGDPDDDDLRLQAGSPCINSGPDEADWQDLDGSRSDRGAFGGPLPHP